MEEGDDAFFPDKDSTELTPTSSTTKANDSYLRELSAKKNESLDELVRATNREEGKKRERSNQG